MLHKPGSIPELDGLRALAIALVLATHILQTVPGLSLVFWGVEWARPLFNGWMGVDLFFVLSGFLVGGQILRELDAGKFSFARFYLRRAFRILPAYFLVTWLVYLAIQLRPGLGAWLVTGPVGVTALIKSTLLLTDYFPTDLGVGSWSLSVEEQFYWLAPCLLVLFRKNSARTRVIWVFSIWALALVLRMIAYRRFDLGPQAPLELVFAKIYYPFHTRMDGLAAGILVFIVTRAASLRAELGATLLKLLGIAWVGAVFCTGMLAGGWLETTLQYSLISAGFAALLAGLLLDRGNPGRTLNALFSHRSLTPIARLSYSLYLVHLLAIRSVEHWLGPSLLRPFVMIGVSLGAAFMLFQFVEAPIHRWAIRRFA